MLKKGLFGILILTLGIMLVFSLSGCRLDSLLSGLIDDAKDDIDDPYGEKYPAGVGGYPSDSSYDPNGTWSFYINSDSATLTINYSSWSFSCNQTSDSGTLYANGSHYTLHSDSSSTDIGTAVMTGYSSMTLTLTPQGISGVYNPTKSGW
jgi:hypothetical protein